MEKSTLKVYLAEGRSSDQVRAPLRALVTAALRPGKPPLVLFLVAHPVKQGLFKDSLVGHTERTLNKFTLHKLTLRQPTTKRTTPSRPR